MGCPGSGKGTQIKRILSKYPNVSTVSSGDELRSNVYRKTQIGINVEKTMKAGNLVSDEIITEIMLQKLRHLNSSWITDGFPRTLKQAGSLSLSHKIDFVINLDVPWKVILDRIENRWVHSPSGRTYNLTFNPPIESGRDDVTGELLTKRGDDNVSTALFRLQEYQNLTVPLINYYEKGGILHNFKGESSDEITPNLMAVLAELLGK